MICDVLLDAVPVDSQAFQRVQGGVQVDIFLQDQLGIHDHVINELAVGQDGSLAVQDLPPFERDRLVFICLLGKDLHSVGLSVVSVDKKQSDL